MCTSVRAEHLKEIIDQEPKKMIEEMAFILVEHSKKLI
jgi:hypothetical protein